MVRFLFSGGMVRMGKEVKLAEKTTLSYSFYLTKSNKNKQAKNQTNQNNNVPTSLYTHLVCSGKAKLRSPNSIDI